MCKRRAAAALRPRLMKSSKAPQRSRPLLSFHDTYQASLRTDQITRPVQKTGLCTRGVTPPPCCSTQDIIVPCTEELVCRFSCSAPREAVDLDSVQTGRWWWMGIDIDRSGVCFCSCGTQVTHVSCQTHTSLFVSPAGAADTSLLF